MAATHSTKTPAEASLRCEECGATRNTKLTPNGRPRVLPPWREICGALYCPACKAKRYVLRAITFPVAGPVGRTWPELREALATAWGQSTSLANWALRELIAADFRRLPSMAKCPPMPDLRRLWPRSGLYAHFVGDYPERSLWGGAAQSASCVLRQVEAKYRGSGRTSQRYRVLWVGDQSLATYRYPFPYPVHNAAWAASFAENGSRWPLVSVPLPGGRWDLRLRGGEGFRRQLAAFGQIASGEAEQGELSLYRVRRHMGDGRNGPVDRAAGGGASFSTEVMCKLVAWLPRCAPGVREKTLRLRTAAHAFWVATVDGRGEPWVLHADHVRRWSMEHARRVRACADDSKAEKRLPAWRKRQLLDRLGDFCRKRDARMDSFLKESAEQLAGFARRQGVAAVQYDDSVRDFVPEFPYGRLEGRLRTVLDQHGIELITTSASGEVVDETSGASRDEGNP